MVASPAPRPFRRRRPAPFTGEWVRAQAAPPRRRLPALPAWVPGERRLAAVLTLLLAAGVALVG